MTFIQSHDQTITFSNQQHGCKKKIYIKTLCWNVLYFHRTETKVTYYKISHKCSA